MEPTKTVTFTYSEADAALAMFGGLSALPLLVNSVAGPLGSAVPTAWLDWIVEQCALQQPFTVTLDIDGKRYVLDVKA